MNLIYLPALNEEEKIGSTIDHIREAINNDPEIDILIVDDGSTDRTAEIALEKQTLVVHHPKNYGVGRAFHTALNYAVEHDYDWMVTIDADGQFDPLEIPILVEKLKEDQASLITGNRFGQGKPENMSSVKYRGNQAVCSIINRIGKQSLHDVSCGFRAYNREALLQLNLFGNFTYTHETILNLSSKNAYIDEVPIHVKYFPERSSRVAKNVFSYGIRALRIIGSVLINQFAMQVFGSLSLIFALVGAFFEFYLLAHYLSTGMFTPYKAFGFIGLGFIILALFLMLFSLLGKLINRLKTNQERILYYQKKYKGKNNG